MGRGAEHPAGIRPGKCVVKNDTRAGEGAANGREFRITHADREHYGTSNHADLIGASLRDALLFDSGAACTRKKVLPSPLS